jgi:hypothetical protein
VPGYALRYVDEAEIVHLHDPPVYVESGIQSRRPLADPAVENENIYGLLPPLKEGPAGPGDLIRIGDIEGEDKAGNPEVLAALPHPLKLRLPPAREDKIRASLRESQGHSLPNPRGGTHNPYSLTRKILVHTRFSL